MGPMPTLAKGNEQIFDSYGRRSNDELLLLYGFSLPRNVNSLEKAKATFVYFCILCFFFGCLN